MSGSSPDLVSSRHLTQAATYADALSSHPSAHRTYTNLAALTHASQLPYRVSAPEPIYENIPLPWREEQTVVEQHVIPPVDTSTLSGDTSVHSADTTAPSQTSSAPAPLTDTSVTSTGKSPLVFDRSSWDDLSTSSTELSA